jgi:hypothetical protein
MTFSSCTFSSITSKARIFLWFLYLQQQYGSLAVFLLFSLPLILHSLASV